MPRLQTPVGERNAQNAKLVSAEAALSNDPNMTVRKAAEQRRARKADASATTLTLREEQLHADLSDVHLKPLGVFLGGIGDFRIMSGKVATLTLMTSAEEFGHVLMDCAVRSKAETLVVAVFTIPRPGMDDDEDKDA